jgi:hypothetical protein
MVEPPAFKKKHSIFPNKEKGRFYRKHSPQMFKLEESLPTGENHRLDNFQADERAAKSHRGTF